jgi:RimJ/RimL family protein N-acetyltransferase
VRITSLKDYWDQGIGSVMVEQLAKWAKASNVVRKINLRVRSDNYRVIHVYEKLGFQHEGLTTRDFYKDGEFYDSNRMGMNIDQS